MLTNQLLFFFSAIGVFNALLLCAYLFLGIKKKNNSHYLLATLLLMFCIRVGVSCIYFFQKNLSPDWIQLGLSANFLVGPILFIYVRLILSEREKLQLIEQLHLWGNGLLIVGFGLFYPFQQHYQIWDNVLRYYIHFQLSLYLIFTTIQLSPVFKNSLFHRSKMNNKEWKALFIFSITALICGGFVVSLYTSYVLGPVFTSCLFYSLVLAAIIKRKQLQNIFAPSKKYGNKRINEQEAAKLLTQLNQLMVEEKLYKNTHLKLDLLAQQLNLTENKLSQLLNDNLGKNYTTYINEYRIEAAKKMLQTTKHFTIEGIGYEVGFNSKTSFYSTFKKLVGLTPAAYKKRLSLTN